MIPGEILCADGDIVLNAGRAAVTLLVANSGNRPVQVGSHYHFAETNAGLRFDRELARGMRLDIAAGTAVRLEPGQTREVTLVPYGSTRHVHGFNSHVMGALQPAGDADETLWNPDRDPTPCDAIGPDAGRGEHGDCHAPDGDGRHVAGDARRK